MEILLDLVRLVHQEKLSWEVSKDLKRCKSTAPSHPLPVPLLVRTLSGSLILQESIL